VVGTASIHLLGVLIGWLLTKLPKGPTLLRVVGAAIAAVGLHLLVA
jgi:urease accessory protein